MKTFDKKFGADFISNLPGSPGIYRIFDSTGALIYVGKAKNLRRRLGQYRNAKRRKRHLKMRSIVADAAKIEVERFETELEACIAETRVIQEQRPKWNVAGAFYFLYPMIGVGLDSGVLSLLYTTEPEAIPSEVLARFSMHGAFRSRFLCGNGFFALVELFEYIGHKNPATRLTRRPGKHSYLYSFRQIERDWLDALDQLFRGESPAALEKLVLALVENAAARQRPKEIQRLLNDVKRFWRHEALLLLKTLRKSGILTYPVPQRERDYVFLQSRYGSKSVVLEREAGYTSARLSSR